MFGPVVWSSHSLSKYANLCSGVAVLCKGLLRSASLKTLEVLDLSENGLEGSDVLQFPLLM